MTFLHVTFATQSLPSLDLARLLHGGQTLHAAGILNVRWEEFSALDAAREAGLTGVVWESVSDNTPGTLELTVWYPHAHVETIRQRLAQIEGIEDYEIRGARHDNAEM
jgi:hypothetical protein